jgi:hypothetical protein
MAIIVTCAQELQLLWLTLNEGEPQPAHPEQTTRLGYRDPYTLQQTHPCIVQRWR